jgi:hypothetical protein
LIAWRCKCGWYPAWQQFCWRHDVVNADEIPPNGTRIGVELLQKNEQNTVKRHRF